MTDIRDLGRAALAVVGLLLVATTPARAGSTERVSVSSSGEQADEGSSAPTISADGRFVAFLSGATNLVLGDTNGRDDVFVRDLQAGTTERVSVATDGTQANNHSGNSINGLEMSATGRFVAFESDASNLVPGDSNGFRDVFVRDRKLGTTERVSVSSRGVQGNGESTAPTISADGYFVAFDSEASNLVPGDSNGFRDVFVRDLQAGTTERVSVSSRGVQGDRFSFAEGISSNGRYVLFFSSASNLVKGDTNGAADVFVRDRRLGTTERVSVSSRGTQGNGSSDESWISGDGRYVVFNSAATNLVPGDTNGVYYDVFVRDRSLNKTERVSVSSRGIQGNKDSFLGIMGRSGTPDGRYVIFWSDATNLVPGDTNNAYDVFIRDRRARTTERLSVSSRGRQGNDSSLSPAISGTVGRFVVFWSAATNLVPGDTNDRADIFVRTR